MAWPSQDPSWTGNTWEQRRHSDDADIVRRGVQPISVTGAQGVAYSNGDVFWLASASGGAAITIPMPSATKNTGAVHFIKLRSTGSVVASPAGGSLMGSATLTASGDFQAWRSDGAAWWPQVQPAASSAPVVTSASFVTSVAYPIGDIAYVVSASADAATITLTFAAPATVVGLHTTVYVRRGNALCQTPSGTFPGLTNVASATLSALGGSLRGAIFLSDGVDWLSIGAPA